MHFIYLSIGKFIKYEEFTSFIKNFPLYKISVEYIFEIECKSLHINNIPGGSNMSKTVRRILASLLIISLPISLAACGKSTEAPKETSAPTTEAASTTSAEAELPEALEDGPLTPYAEMLEITVPLSEAANTFYVEGESIEDNFVTRFYTEKLNIKYKGKWQVDSAQAGEKLNTAIASNDLPDMFTAGPELMGRLIKAGQVQPLDEVYQKYASSELRKICEYQDGRGFLAAKSEGKIYGLPVSNDFANNVAMLFIRKDWMDKLGLQVPKTMDELVAIAKAFRDKDPDGNGKNDTIPIAMDKNFGQDRAGINSFSNPFKAYSQIWIPDGNGGLKYSSIQPEMKTSLEFMQTMYKEGLLDKEFAVKDGSKVAEDIAAGKIGIFPGVFWSSLWPLAGTIDNNAEADWLPVPIPVNTDNELVTQNKIFSYFNVVVRKGFEHPEALIKSMNLWYEMFHGEYADKFNDMLSTEKYMPIADNWHGYAKPMFFAHPEKNVYLSENFIEAWNANHPSLLKTGEARNRWEIIKKGGSQGWAHKKFLTEAEPVLKNYKPFVFDEFVGAPTKTMVLRTANLQKLEYETFMAIIMGKSIDSFDTFVNDWKVQGGDDITKEVAEWYKSVQ
jgi:putative aldouronate transport system substrate-binding protein